MSPVRAEFILQSLDFVLGCTRTMVLKMPPGQGRTGAKK